MDDDPRRELAEFLKARRTRVRPEDVGLEPGPRRRVPGLRREELALLAGVSSDYYQRMEQGRDVLDYLTAICRSINQESGRGYPTIIEAMQSAGVIKSKSFSLWLDDVDSGTGSPPCRRSSSVLSPSA